MTSACNGDGEKTYTSFVIKTPPQTLGNLCWVDKLEKITLTQEPSETLNFHLRTKHTQTLSSIIEYSFSLTLTFDNNLHEVSQDYGYDVICKGLINDNGIIYHVYLFSGRAIRMDKEICFNKTFFANKKSNEQLIHICFLINRFNKNNNDIEREIPCDFDNGQIPLKNSFLNDISLIVGDEFFPAHRDILSSRSEVFKSMFTHKMSENQEGKVKIDEFQPQVIDAMLNYIYTGKMKNLSEIADELFKAAHKYEIIDLKALCEEYFLFNLKHENITSTLNFANFYGIRYLKKRALIFIDIHWEELVKDDSFLAFLYGDLNVHSVASLLQLYARDNNLSSEKLETLKFVQNSEDDISSEDFFHLSKSYSLLTKQVFKYIYKDLFENE